MDAKIKIFSMLKKVKCFLDFFYNLNLNCIMARVTVEDCVKIIDNRFELILIASERAKTLAKGVETSSGKR